MYKNTNLEDTMFKVSEGRTYEMIYSHFCDFIKNEKSEAMEKILSNFRIGKTDSVTLSSLISAYCAIDDLERKLLKKIKVGNTAAKGMIDGDGSR